MTMQFLHINILFALCFSIITPLAGLGQNIDYLYDPSFTPPNVVGGNGGNASSILVHEDGRYTVSGGFQFNAPFYLEGIVRFFNNGSLDETFYFPGDVMSINYVQFYESQYLV